MSAKAKRPRKTPPPPQAEADNARLDRILAGLQGRYGGTTTALDYRNPFELLVAVMLSAQTTDVYVNKVTPGLFARFPDAKALAMADVSEVETRIRGVGFFRTKAKNLVMTAKLLVRDYGGDVPGDWEALVTMPGVGRKTANVVVSTAFNVPAIAVDTHVFRVSNRLGLAAAKTPEETERQLQQAIPRERWSEAHHWLIWHGRKICKAPVPKCEVCFLTADCRYYQTQAASNAKPAATPKQAGAKGTKTAKAKAPRTPKAWTAPSDTPPSFGVN